MKGLSVKGTNDRGGGGGRGGFVNSSVKSSAVTSLLQKTSSFSCSSDSSVKGFSSETAVAETAGCKGGRTTLKAGTGVIISLEARTGRGRLGVNALEAGVLDRIG